MEESEDAGVTLTWGVGDAMPCLIHANQNSTQRNDQCAATGMFDLERRITINPRLTRCVFPSPGGQMKVSYTCATTVTEAVHSSIPSELRKTRPHRILPAVLSACTGTRRRIKRINVFRSHFAHLHRLAHMFASPTVPPCDYLPPIVPWSGKFLCRVVTSSKPPGMTSLLYR